MSESSPVTFPVTTALELQGMTIERNLGLTYGLVVRSMGVAKSMGAGFTALRRGEVPQYTELLEDSRRRANGSAILRRGRSYRCGFDPADHSRHYVPEPDA